MRKLTLLLLFVASLATEALAQHEIKNIIFLIGDGMGVNQTLLYEAYDARSCKYSDNEEIFYGYLFPSQGFARTDSLSGTTDSAAAGTALACGYKTINGYVGLDKNGNEVQLSTICNEDDNPPYSQRNLEIPDFSSFDSDEDELKESFQIEDEDGNVIEDEEEIFDSYDGGSDEH